MGDRQAAAAAATGPPRLLLRLLGRARSGALSLVERLETRCNPPSRWRNASTVQAHAR